MKDILVNVDYLREDILVSVELNTLRRTDLSVWISGRTVWSILTNSGRTY